jgi:cleavage and polyadenylation specificity factor subunit 1
MMLFGKTSPNLQVRCCDFLPYEKSLYMAVGDADENLHILQYDPENPKSLGGTRLVHKSTFHIGHLPQSFKMIPLLPRPTTSISTAAHQSPLTPNVETGEMIDPEALPDAPTGVQPPQEQSPTHALLLTTCTGVLAIIQALSESRYRRLASLQTHLSTSLEPWLALNPRAYRASNHDRDIPLLNNAAGGAGGIGGLGAGAAGNRGVLDGTILNRWKELGVGRWVDLLGRVDLGMADAEEMAGGGGLGSVLSQSGQSVIMDDLRIAGGDQLWFL